MDGDDNNSYEAGSTLTGTVYLQKPTPAAFAVFGEEGEEKSANSSYYEMDGAEVVGGTLTLALEGREATTITGESKKRLVYNDSYCFLRQEKKFPLYISSSGTAVIQFSLNIPHDLPEPIQLYQTNMNDRSTFQTGKCSLRYSLTAHWEPHQMQQDTKDNQGIANPIISSPPQRANISTPSSTLDVDIVAAKKQSLVDPQQPSSLALSVTSSVEIPSYFCGFLCVVSTRTTFALNVDPNGR